MFDKTSAVKVFCSCLHAVHDVSICAYTSHSINPVCILEHEIWSLFFSSGPRLLLINSRITRISSHITVAHMTNIINGIWLGTIVCVYSIYFVAIIVIKNSKLIY